MKTIFRNRLKVKNIWKVKLMLLIAATILSCSKEYNPEMEASRLGASSQELLLGKWYVNLAPSIIASDCLAQYYLDFNDEEVKNISTLNFIDDQLRAISTTIPLTKTCELPDEIKYTYSWNDDQNITIMMGSRTVTLSIISVSKTHLIILNKASYKMMVLKKRP